MLKIVLSIYKDDNAQPLFQIRGDAFESLCWVAEDDKKGIKDDGRVLKNLGYWPNLPRKEENKD